MWIDVNGQLFNLSRFSTIFKWDGVHNYQITLVRNHDDPDNYEELNFAQAEDRDRVFEEMKKKVLHVGE